MGSTDTTIADQVVVLQQQSAARLPAEVRAVFGAQVARLDAAGLPAGIPGPGAVNLTLRVYQDKLAPELDARGVALIAVSPQKPDGALSMQGKNELSFTVLSDPGNQIGARLGILSAQGDDMRAARAKLGVNVAATNADGTDMLPMPTVVIVDTTGTIRWIDVHPNYTIRTEPAEILAALANVDR